jgi:hypothetical protein
MNLRATALGFLGAALVCGSVYAADGAQKPDVPPDKAMRLSQIVANVEGRDGFRYIDEIEWDEDGYYDVVYFTTDKAKVEMKFNPVTGQPE